MPSRSFRLIAVLVAWIFSAAGSAGTQGADKSDALGSCSLRGSIGTPNNPERTVAVSFHQSSQVQACNEIAPKLMRQRNSIKSAYSYNISTKEHRELAASYFKTCLTGDPAVYAPQLSPADIASTKDRTMLLTGKDGRPECHGFRLNGHIVTADHCLGTAKLNDEIKVRTLDSAQPLKAVLTLRGGVEGRSRLDRDYAILKLQSPVAGDGATDLDWLDAPIGGNRVFITQVNTYALIAQDAELQGSLASAAVTLDNPTCRFGVGRTDEYLLHGCPTEGGTSGAAYIQKGGDGRLRLVGVHGGETSGLPKRELSDCARSLANYGVMLPLDTVRQAVR